MNETIDPEAGLTRDAVLTKHQNAAQAVAYWRVEEMRLRRKIDATLFPNPTLSGTLSLDLGGGNILKCQRSVDYTLADKNGETKAMFQKLLSGNPEMAAALIRWKPELSVTAYKALPKSSSLHTIINPVLTVKPTTPVLEYVKVK